MTAKELKEKVDAMMRLFDEVEQYFIEKIATQIKDIGELSQSNINRLIIMSEMNENIADINARIRQAANVTTGELYRIYNTALNDTYTDPRFERALKESPLSEEARRRLEQMAQTIANTTAGTMMNLSNTTIVSSTYRNAVDRAVLAVSTGMGDYKAATRNAVRELGYNGLQVQYPSGYHRRLDTALRQNIIDGARHITVTASQQMGDELGYDAIELSAHLMSAPDHEPVQGRVFLKAEFEKMQSGMGFSDIDGNHYAGFRRPIGEWNCMHFPLSFSTKYSKRTYTDQQLQEWADQNNTGFEIDGKRYSTYEVSQLMRKIETQIRREKDAAVAAKAAGDDQLRKDCQVRINALSAKYNQVVNISGVTARRDRMRVEGFRMVKV
ncbi:MAG: phage minor capsid protein [Bilifractor sp.]